MIKHNQDGAVNGLVVSLILATVLLIATLAFGAWAFSSRQDYKNHADIKIKSAVEIAKQQEDVIKTEEFAQKAKLPLKTYQSREANGSQEIQFPKTWSAYVDDSGKGSAILDGYFSPGVVPSISDPNSVFSLRVQIVDQTYAQVLKSFAGQQQSAKLTISAYALPKLPKIVGVKVVGQLTSSKAATTTMVVLPLRSQTMKISTEGNQYLDDFNNHILPNFSFSP